MAVPATAAALINDGRTALGLLAGGGIQPQEWVLVLPGGSGLGLVLIQLARAYGARVIAAARGTTKLDIAIKAGAAATVDYTDTDWSEQVRTATGGHGLDVVFGGVGGRIGRVAFEATTRGAPGSTHCRADVPVGVRRRRAHGCRGSHSARQNSATHLVT